MRLSLSQLRARAEKVKLLLMDVDGTMTDGRIYFHLRPGGNVYETKGFDSRDGLGIRLAHQSGLRTGIISGRSSPAVEHRVKDLGIEFLQEGMSEKIEPYEKILRAAQLSDEEVCFMGDDIVDLPLLKRVGLAVGVSSGDPRVRPHVHYWTKRAGGDGAVREVIELILGVQGKWDAVLSHYLR